MKCIFDIVKEAQNEQFPKWCNFWVGFFLIAGAWLQKNLKPEGKLMKNIFKIWNLWPQNLEWQSSMKSFSCCIFVCDKRKKYNIMRAMNYKFFSFFNKLYVNWNTTLCHFFFPCGWKCFKYFLPSSSSYRKDGGLGPQHGYSHSNHCRWGSNYLKIHQSFIFIPCTRGGIFQN